MRNHPSNDEQVRRMLRLVGPKWYLKMALSIIVSAIALGVTALWLVFHVSPRELILATLRGEQVTTITGGASLEQSFRAFKAFECEGKLTTTMWVDNSTTYNVPLIGGIPYIGDAANNLLEVIHNGVSQDVAGFVVNGEFGVVAPFDPSNGFRYQIDDVTKTVDVFITRFIVASADGDPVVVGRSQGLATMLSTEDPLWEQANVASDQLVASLVAEGGGEWFEQCRIAMQRQWQVLAALFGYTANVRVLPPEYPLSVDLAYGSDAQDIVDVLAELTNR